MNPRYLLGLDAGGGGLRCLLIETETRRIITAAQPWSARPVPSAGAWARELDLPAIWRALAATPRQALARAGAEPAQVLGLAITSMRHSLVLLDAHGEPCFAVPNLDARASAEAMELAQERGPQLYTSTGHWPAPILLAARLLWLARHAPETLAAARQAFTLSDWLAYRLTGVAAAERSHAGETLLLDLHTRAWADDLITDLGLPRALCLPLQDAGARLGTLTPAAAEALGLPEGLPVAVGGADTQSALLGTGALAPGQLAAIAGTTAPVQLVTERPLTDAQRRLWTGLHVLPDRWVLESNAGSMGSALDWVARLLCPDAPNPAAALAAAAGAAEPGAGGLSSTIGASLFNAGQLSLPVETLAFSHELLAGLEPRPAVARAVLEGLAYALKANIAQLLEVAGTPLQTLHLSGGLSRSAVWAQIVSDVLDAPVDVAATPESSALGAALCAGVGAGLYPDLPAAAAALLTPGREFRPEATAARFYRQGFADWSELLAQRSDADLTLANTLVEGFAGRAAPSPPHHLTLSPSPSAFRPRMLVTAAMDESGLAALRELGEVSYGSFREELRLLTGEDLVEALQGMHVFITEVDIVDADALAQLPDLRVIGVCRGAPVNVDIAACSACGIPVLNTPGRNAVAVAELTVAALLMLLRALPEASAFLREPGGEAGDMGRMGMAFERFQGRELWGKTVGLIGLGAVGREVARRLLPFGAHLLVADPYITAEEATLAGAEKVPLETLLTESAIISLHAPVTPETRGMLDAAAFARMQPGALLLNTARAALVEQDALLEALRSGRLGGAALDVFATEPPGAQDPLLAFTNVIATPHIGGNTVEVAAHQGQIIAADLARLLRGERPLHLQNPEALEAGRDRAGRDRAWSWTAPRRMPAAGAHTPSATAPAVTDLQAQAAHAAPTPPLSPSPTPAPAPQKGWVLAGLRRALGVKPPAFPSAPTPAPAPALTPAPAPAPTPTVSPPHPLTSSPSPAAAAAHAQFTRLLEAFTATIRADAGLREFAQGKHVLMSFILTDLGLSFYLNFQDGSVDAAPAAPPANPDVTLKMTADTLDGIFTGRINAMRSAMSGKLAFSGDTGKAMAFQRIQKDLGTLYTAASNAVGGPGDLSAAAAPAASPTPPLPPSPSLPLSPSPAPTPAPANDIRAELLATLNELYAHGLITATGGNLSARVEGREDELWITPSMSFKGDLRPESMVRIDLDGRPLDPDGGTPSSEWRVHTALYRRRPDLQAVIHTHAPQTILLGLSGKPFLPISTEAAFIGELARVPFMMPGTAALAEAVAEALGQGAAVLMEHHGLVVGGSSLRRAANVTEIIEDTARKILACYALGAPPATLPEESLAQLREIGRMMV